MTAVETKTGAYIRVKAVSELYPGADDIVFGQQNAIQK
jgi:hypothetical protein